MALDIRGVLVGESLELKIAVGDLFGRLQFRHGDRNRDMIKELLEPIAFERIGKAGAGKQLLDPCRIRLIGHVPPLTSDHDA
jgi:hypothetical protein